MFLCVPLQTFLFYAQSHVLSVQLQRIVKAGVGPIEAGVYTCVTYTFVATCRIVITQ